MRTGKKDPNYLSGTCLFSRLLLRKPTVLEFSLVAVGMCGYWLSQQNENGGPGYDEQNWIRISVVWCSGFFKELGRLVSSKIPFVRLKCWLFLKCCKSQPDVLVEQTVTCKLLYGCLLPWMQGQLMQGSLAWMQGSLAYLSHGSTDVGVIQRVHFMFCCLDVYITLFAPMRDNWLKVCHGRTYIHFVPCCPILS